MDKQRIVRQLRAKADSTTFPHEAAALRERADRLEAKYGPPPAPAARAFDVAPAPASEEDEAVAAFVEEMLRRQAEGRRPPPATRVRDDGTTAAVFTSGPWTDAVSAYEARINGDLVRVTFHFG